MATGTGLKASGAWVRGLHLEWGVRTYVMGVLNVTPDSFSGDGTASDVAVALRRAVAAIEGGADILDVGGESTRPGAMPVTAAEEVGRVVPVVEAIRSRYDVPISIDTHKAEVARAALDAGADMVNDVWGLRADPDMAGLVACRRVPVVLMHNRSDPTYLARSDRLGGHYVNVEYVDLVADVCRDLGSSVALARAAGIDEDRIVLDPGLGFGKTAEQNLVMLDRTAAIRSLGYPVMVGPSRKSFIGLTLGLAPTDRVEGTAAAVAVAIARGADIVRVHDVLAMSRVARMTDAIVRSRRD